MLRLLERCKTENQLLQVTGFLKAPKLLARSEDIHLYYTDVLFTQFYRIFFLFLLVKTFSAINILRQ